MRVKPEPDSGLEPDSRTQSGSRANSTSVAQNFTRKVPSVSASSGWGQPELGQSSLGTTAAAGRRFQGALDASEAVPDLYPQSMDMDALDGMARELDDSRQGSPCQRAAAEMLEPGFYGEDLVMQPEGACLPLRDDQGFAVPQQQFLAPGAANQAPWPSGGAFPQPPKQEPWEGGPGAWGTSQQPQAQPWCGQPAPGGQLPLQGGVPEQYGAVQAPAFGPAQPTHGPLHQGQAQANHGVPGGSAGPQLGPAVPAGEGGDWLTFIMDQAFSVGLWGGNPGTEPMEQVKGHLSGGAPVANGAPQGRQGGPFELPASGEPKGARDSRSFYQAEMEAMLPQHCGPRGDGGTALMQGLGHISREQQLQPAQAQQQRQMKQEPAREMPRLQPVSLGMTSSSLSQMLACSAMEGMNDGPFRPPTRLPVGAADKAAGNSRYPVSHPSMLQQSRLQLSLGLDAGTPIDLRSWGYGEESNNTGKGQAGGDSVCVTSDPQEDGHRTMDCTKTSDSCSVDLSALMPLSSSVSLPAIKIGISPSASSRHNSLNLSVKASALASPRHLWDNGCLTDGEGRVRPIGSNSHRPGLEEAAATRAECLERYREKKRRRLIHKTIRYHKRKVNADNRPRIKGRFVKSSDSKPDSGMEMDGSTIEGLATLAEVKEAAQNLAGEAFGDLLVPGQTQLPPHD